MKRFWAIALALALLSAPSAAQTPRPIIDFSDIVEKLRPAVVMLDVTKTRISPRQLPMPPEIAKFLSRDEPPAPRERKEGGTGFVFDAAKGLIVTGDYVIADATSIEIFLPNGEVRKAEVVGLDSVSGVGLVRIAPEGLVAVDWSDRNPRDGEPVLGYGGAYGMTPVATAGIVASADPTFYAVESPFSTPAEVMLLDLPAHKGSVGGLIVDQTGVVIGMMTGQYGSADYANFNLGVAIPAAEVRRIALILERDGKVERGAIGISIRYERARGVYIDEIIKGSPAERAGLEVGDVVISAAGQTVGSDRSLTRLIARQPIGAIVPMTIERDGRRIELSLTVERRTD